MKKATKQIIAYDLTREEALAAQRSLSNTMKCALESITTTIDPTVIYSLQADEVDLVGVKAHSTDQSQWSLLMPVCRQMKEKASSFKSSNNRLKLAYFCHT